jgi:hypothetical protein
LLVGLICLALVVGVGVFVVARGKSAAATRRHQASAAAAQFLRTWASGNLSALPAQTVTGSATVAKAYALVDLALGIATKPGTTATASRTPTPPAAGLPIKFELAAPIGSGDLITVPATITIDIPGLGTWRNPIKLRVRAAGNGSLVDWSPQTITSALKTGDQIRVARTVPSRAAILGTGGQPLPVSADVRALVGTVGPATAAQAKADPGLRTGDPIGQSGLQASSDATLRGAPSGNVIVVDPAGRVVATLATWAGRAPAPVSSSVNPTMQAAAAAAISHTGHPSALVAIDTTNGAVLAAASNPAGYPRALMDQYPPGSTFKMVTLTAALMAGRTLASPTSCSPTATVDGESFRNAGGESFGAIPLLQAFAVSCNTSFINLAESLPTARVCPPARLLPQPGCSAATPAMPPFRFPPSAAPTRPAPLVLPTRHLPSVKEPC